MLQSVDLLGDVFAGSIWRFASGQARQRPL